MRKTCSIPNCINFAHGHGWCRKHYTRWRRHGNPLLTPRFDPLEKRFFRHVEKTGNCWIWTGASNSGYGTFMVSQRPGVAVKAHRFSYELRNGKIPDGFYIDHLCRNPSCVNPDHLEAVTPKENVLRGNTITAYNASKTECIRGHPFDEQNTGITHRGGRRCRTCDREWMRMKRKNIKSLMQKSD